MSLSMITNIKPKSSQFQEMFNRMYPDVDKHGLSVKTFTFVVTERCTLNCNYCYQICKQNKTMTKDIARKTIDLLFEGNVQDEGYINKYNTQGIILDFIGGEPLLEIDLIDYAVEYFKYKAVTLQHPWAIKYMISITSNGTEYFNDKVQKFLQKNQGRVSFAITIDGNKELHDSCRKFHNGKGSYDIVEKAVKHQLSHYNNSHTKLTLAPENIMYLNDAIANLYNIGLTNISANCVFEEGWNVDHAKIFYSELKKLADRIINNDLYKNFNCTLFDDTIGQPKEESDNDNWCGGSGKMLAVDTDGNLYPCLRYMKFSLGDSQPPMIIGDVDNGVGYNENQQENIGCLNCITRRSQSTDECFNCPIASGCAWCSAYNYQVTGTPNKRVTYICIMHKARVMANCYYYNKLYKKLGIDKKFELLIPKTWALEIISEEEFNMLKELSE